MKKYIAKRSEQGISKTDIIAINSKAKQDALNGNKVINASIGTFLEDDKTLGFLSMVKEALSEHINDSLGYPSSLGDPQYLKGIMNYVFEDKLETINKLYHPFIGATLGGTGAISLSLNLFLEEGETVLLPNIMWSNYKLVATKAKVKYLTYEMFNEDNKFNIASVKETIKKAFSEHRRAVLIINDPCQNPTGYCMDKQEYDDLFTMLNEEGKNGQLIVLFDIAYISFLNINDGRCPLIDKLCEGNTSFLSLIAFSTSKTLGTYGLRMGALIALVDSEEEKEQLSNSFYALARGTYSVPVGSAQAAIANLFNDPNKINQLHTEIKRNSDLMYNRSKLLLKYLDKYNIDHYPYKCGFFVTLKVEDAYGLAEKLEKEHMYVVPMNNHSVRIALSGLNDEEIVTLITKIKELI